MAKQNHKPSHSNPFTLNDHPFPQPNAHSKHSFRQVNGETRQAQNIQILEVQTRKRS
ncbi:YpzG family protein [Sutcliffiella horikoshii]|uniref:YpzG family protein n=1 Tax=Sutcliffiella horikoshii TaxID=79883 RepID=UPI0009EECF15|nr:YpzG family protein [Sutcliffiella horikoshii]MCM3619976.1 YpzG family protein [Sutcliffiella horikoshii]